MTMNKPPAFAKVHNIIDGVEEDTVERMVR
jgi:hypothetical protein